MKKISIFIILISLIVMNQNVKGQAMKREDWTIEKAKIWFETGDWKNGWKIIPHSSVNIQEFAYQYHKNKILWDKVFTYLNSTGLDTLSPGKHVLHGDDLFISVSEGPLKDFDATKWEAHKKYVDIQYVIQGKEKMGIIPIQKVSVLEIFDPTKDLGFYTVPEDEAKYYEATPETFLIFFPGDAHRPSIKIPGFDADKKLVVKIKAD